MAADRATDGEDIECVERISIGQIAHSMGYTGVDEMDCGVESGDLGGRVELQVVWFGHRDADIFTDHVGGERAGDRFEGDTIGDVITEVGGEAAEATGAIAAHFGFAAIGIVVAEAEVCAVLRGFDREQSVGADATVAVAEGFDRLCIEFD